jgi:hypothetical protein
MVKGEANNGSPLSLWVSKNSHSVKICHRSARTSLLAVSMKINLPAEIQIVSHYAHYTIPTMPEELRKIFSSEGFYHIYQNFVKQATHENFPYRRRTDCTQSIETNDSGIRTKR